jgi:hypothetical protein
MMTVQHHLCAAVVCGAMSASAQFNLVATSSTPLVPLKSLESGIKLITPMSAGANERVIRNLDLSLFRTLTFPAPPTGHQWTTCSYVTEALFDTEPSSIEFILMSTSVSGPGDIHFLVCRENGEVLFQQSPGAAVAGVGNGTTNFWDPVFVSEGIAYLLLHESGGFGVPARLYELPGTLPCMDCYGSPSSSGIGLGDGPIIDGTSGFALFPNPNSGMVNVDLGSLQADALHVLDAAGQLARIVPVNGQPRLSISTWGMAPGRYLVMALRDGRSLVSLPLVMER